MNEPIKFIRLDKQYESLKGEILPAVNRVLSSGKVLQGPEVENFENNIKKLHNISFAIAVNSGTDALTFALKSAGIKKGDRIAVTSLSFVASASSIVNAGGIPVFTDVDKDSYLMNLEEVYSLIDAGKIRGVVAVHLYGQMMDVRELYERTRQKGMILIEDAAQCLGAVSSGYPPGMYSDVCCISFDPMKVIGAYGSGGVILTNEEIIYQQARKLRYHGQCAPQEYDIVGYNSQMPSLQAEILNIKLKYLEKWEIRRRAIAELYSRNLEMIPEVKLPVELSGAKHIYHKYVIQAKDRDGLKTYLEKNGIQTMIHYKLPLFRQKNMQPFYDEKYEKFIVNDIVKNILSLPIYPELADEEVIYICDKIKEFYGRK